MRSPLSCFILGGHLVQRGPARGGKEVEEEVEVGKEVERDPTIDKEGKRHEEVVGFTRHTQ